MEHEITSEMKLLIKNLRQKNYSKVTIKFINWDSGLTDINHNIVLTDIETIAVKWFCWQICLKRGVIEIEPKTGKIKLKGDKKQAIAPVTFQF